MGQRKPQSKVRVFWQDDVRYMAIALNNGVAGLGTIFPVLFQ